MSESTEPGPGLWASVTRTLNGVLSAVQTRLELFALELQEEKCRLVETLLCAAALAAFGMMSLTLGTLALVGFFWESARLAVLGGLSIVYLVAAIASWRALQRRLRDRTPFSATLDELRKDRS